MRVWVKCMHASYFIGAFGLSKRGAQPQKKSRRRRWKRIGVGVMFQTINVSFVLVFLIDMHHVSCALFSYSHALCSVGWGSGGDISAAAVGWVVFWWWTAVSLVVGGLPRVDRKWSVLEVATQRLAAGRTSTSTSTSTSTTRRGEWSGSDDQALGRPAHIRLPSWP